jgi:MYXO-CTERM domain-containing protein
LRTALALASLTFCLPACIAAPPGGELDQPIIGGTVDNGDPGVVLVIADDGKGGESLCTGEVVSPHVVFTAAHCVDPASVGNGNSFYVFTGSDYNTGQGTTLAAKETHYDNQFDLNQLQNGHDVAVVVTTTKIAAAPLPLNTDPLPNNAKGATVRLIGYGVNSGNDQQGTSAGVKRVTSTVITDFDSMFLLFTDPNHMTCEGDSGGPAMMTLGGVEKIVGITSFGDQGCMQSGYDTRVDTYANAFVVPYINQFDPGFLNGMGGSPDMAMQQQGSPDLAMQQQGGPDLAMGQQGGADLAGGGGGRDMAMMSFPPGSVGAACKQHSDCMSKACAVDGPNGGFCTQPCDPTMLNSCPAGTVCGLIGGQHYCVLPALNGSNAGGCSMGGGAAGHTTTLVLLALALLGLVLTRRRSS